MAIGADSWEMFPIADAGDSVEEVVETAACKVLQLNDPSGDGLMTIYRVFDGVYLIFNDFHLTRCRSQFASCTNLLCMEHCREGRSEHRCGHDLRCYIEPGDLRIDRQISHTDCMEFPLSHYHGITIAFSIDIAECSIRETMPGMSIDIAALAQKFCGENGLYVLRKNASIDHIFSELYHVPAKIRMDYFKIKVMELLVFLGAVDLSDSQDNRPYFHSSQIEKIKSVHDLVTEDLSANYTTEELAHRFDLSVSALKNGFKEVYGSPIYTYIRASKMNAAAALLAADCKKRIIDVASSVGYDNPSKFAAAFKEMFGMTPAEYRCSRK